MPSREDIRRSLSWRLTAPVRFLIDGDRAANDPQTPVETSLSWRLTAPLRWLGAPVVSAIQAPCREHASSLQAQLMYEHARTAALADQLRAASRLLALAHDNAAPALMEGVHVQASLAAFQPGQGVPPDASSVVPDLLPLQRQDCLRQWHALTVQLGEQTPEWVYQAMTSLMRGGDDFGIQPEEVGACWGDMDKHAVLAHVHERLEPEQYLEIGVSTGVSLRLARCPAIGIDPAPQVPRAVLADWMQLIPLTSDRYFDRVRRGRATPPVPDLVFIDGMHLIESVLRDLANVERLARPSTLVVIDDIYPCHPTQALRQRVSGAWTGDVWKVVELLRTHRPDLTLLPLQAYTTGLLLVAGLDPGNRTFLERVGSLPVDPDRPPPESVLTRVGALPSDHPLVDQLLAVLRAARLNHAGVGEVREELRSITAVIGNRQAV
jgi:hypothetical protein